MGAAPSTADGVANPSVTELPLALDAA